jgi:hypothetical protein
VEKQTRPYSRSASFFLTTCQGTLDAAGVNFCAELPRYFSRQILELERRLGHAGPGDELQNLGSQLVGFARTSLARQQSWQAVFFERRLRLVERNPLKPEGRRSLSHRWLA